MAKRHSRSHGHHEHDEPIRSRSRHSGSEDESITISKTALWQIVSGVFAVLFVASLFTGGFGLGTGTAATGTGTQAAPSPSPGPTPSPSPAQGVDVSFEGARTKGDPDAPVVMVEYSSFTCPFCMRFNYQDGTFDRIKEEYIDTGQVFYVYKHFTRNEMDVVAANAAECAGEQDMFWEYKGHIYENQGSIGQQGIFATWAEQLGLDMSAWTECFESGRYSQKASQDLQEGQRNGITGTPGFLINDQRVAGAQPFQAFQSAIEAQLN